MEEDKRKMRKTADTILYGILDNVPKISSRVYPLAAPEACGGAFAVYRQVSDTPFRLISGSSGVNLATFSVALVSAQYSELLDITADVIVALEAIEEDFILNVTVEEEDPEAYEVDADLYNTAVTVQMTYRKE